MPLPLPLPLIARLGALPCELLFCGVLDASALRGPMPVRLWPLPVSWPLLPCPTMAA